MSFSSNSFPFRQAVDLYRGGVSCQCSFTQQVLIEHRELRDEKGNRCLPANEGGCGHFVSEHSVGSFDVFLLFPLFPLSFSMRVEGWRESWKVSKNLSCNGHPSGSFLHFAIFSPFFRLFLALFLCLSSRFLCASFLDSCFVFRVSRFSLDSFLIFFCARFLSRFYEVCRLLWLFRFLLQLFAFALARWLLFLWNHSHFVIFFGNICLILL